jgi:hypothetical protein
VNTTGGETPEDDQKAMKALEALATWSAWVPLAVVRVEAPRLPGVYMAREGATGRIIYVGMAGERDGRGRVRPKGIWGRLSVYSSGKGAVSGLGEAAFDRALADPDWIANQLTSLRAGQVRRTKHWAREALVRADLHLRWATCPDKASARALEIKARMALGDQELWKRVL